MVREIYDGRKREYDAKCKGKCAGKVKKKGGMKGKGESKGGVQCKDFIYVVRKGR